MSLPSLGAWIETRKLTHRRKLPPRRSLHWERGLKQIAMLLALQTAESLPSLGAWIET